MIDQCLACRMSYNPLNPACQKCVFDYEIVLLGGVV